jgi:predicted ATPase
MATQIFAGLGGIGAMILIGWVAARNLKGGRGDVDRRRIDDRRSRLRSSGIEWSA